MDIAETLKLRDALYGDYGEQSVISCSLKDVMREGRNWSQLQGFQRETLEMIAVKMSRILNGDMNCYDSWHDIEGYAKLTADRLKK